MENDKIILRIRGNMGYSADQVNSITVGELKDLLEGYDDDMEIVTKNTNNKYGANFGEIINLE